MKPEDIKTIAIIIAIIVVVYIVLKMVGGLGKVVGDIGKVLSSGEVQIETPIGTPIISALPTEPSWFLTPSLPLVGEMEIPLPIMPFRPMPSILDIYNMFKEKFGW